jgi:hypothetical protein
MGDIMTLSSSAKHIKVLDWNVFLPYACLS